jgi:hypothetical protein
LYATDNAVCVANRFMALSISSKAAGKYEHFEICPHMTWRRGVVYKLVMIRILSITLGHSTFAMLLKIALAMLIYIREAEILL